MTQFIAEVCSNHNGDLNRALALIDKAAEIGCDAVKFQLFRIDQLFAPEALNHPSKRDMLHARRQWELPLHWLPVLKARCIERGIQFGVTPFYVGAVEELLPFVDFYKVASYSLLDRVLLQAVAKTLKPVILSTGMATIKEVSKALDFMIIVLPLGEHEYLDRLTLLHCVSTYPMPIEESNPRFYDELDRWSSCLLGWSDHSVDPAVIYFYAIQKGADTVEFHLDLDGQGVEYGIGHCWLPEQIQPVIEMVKRVQKASAYLGDYEVSPSEQAERLWRADPSDGLRPLMEERERLR